MSVFMESPTRSFGWKELSRKARLGPPSTKRYLDDLRKEGIVAEKTVAGRRFYFANRDSRLYRIYKRLDTMLRLEKSGFVEFMNNKYGYPPIILFGSHSSGEATEDSDIDIAVLTESKKDADVRAFEKLIGKEIHVFRLSRSALKALRKENKSMYQGLFNGCMISGFAEVD